LFDNEAVKVFEIGTVFPRLGEEKIRLGLAIGLRKKIKGKEVKTEIDNVIQEIKNAIGWANSLPHESDFISEGGLVLVSELDFEKLVDMTGPAGALDLAEIVNQNADYHVVSPYPRIIRDVAVWVPKDVGISEVQDLIIKAGGELMVVGPILFDQYEKDDRKSLAFRMVFQSYEKTLSDEEANIELVKIISALKSRSDFEVRD
jgi:phenylalanyl-tRNA synthetase beta subunit